jgi:hypothetical protein
MFTSARILARGGVLARAGSGSSNLRQRIIPGAKVQSRGEITRGVTLATPWVVG